MAIAVPVSPLVLDAADLTAPEDSESSMLSSWLLAAADEPVVAGFAAAIRLADWLRLRELTDRHVKRAAAARVARSWRSLDLPDADPPGQQVMSLPAVTRGPDVVRPLMSSSRGQTRFMRASGRPSLA